ncbi:MAG: amino acid synthesis family protein [Acidimicrobiia bacterium]
MTNVRKLVTLVEDVTTEAGIQVVPVLRKVAVAAVVTNPYAGVFSPDLSDIIRFSEQLGDRLSALLVAAMEDPVQSYGKAAIAGSRGEVEHTHAFLTSVMANRLREAVGGGKAWIPSTGKRGAMGASIDVPLACKDALFVRSHYDTVTVSLPDAPEPDEVVVIVAGANRGRPNFRLGGVRYDEIEGEDGLR